MTTTEIKQLVADTINHPNIIAFRKMVQHTEGSDFDIRFPGMGLVPKITNFKDHPRLIVCIDKNGKICSKDKATLCSDAAGIAQFMSYTWDRLANGYGKDFLPDFTPQSQLKGFSLLLVDRGCLRKVIDGRLTDAINIMNKEWASLPNSPYGQPTHTMADCIQAFIKNGGNPTN